MSTNLFELKKKKETELSQQFSFWLNQERGSQVRGIEFFLNQRSKNIDRLIVETSKEYKLDQIPELGIFTVGGYGRAGGDEEDGEDFESEHDRECDGVRAGMYH